LVDDAVNVAVSAVLTPVIVVEKLAVVAPAATATDAGTLTELLLLARFTVRLLGAAAVSVTTQVSVPAPVTEPFAQLSALSEDELDDDPDDAAV
jgi:hypothetical protein